ncbi:MAG: acyl-homoserine-lactone acylase [Chloroflexota bacterium]|jgi:acyl-homoserine-lactone acylase|nr:acyl-homoserine-lactone acylase [Chloroflexota bacterium]
MAIGVSPLLATVPPLGGGAALADDAYSATVRRTSHGIPHILASNYGGIGFGYGYAFAQDNLCVIADQYVTVSAERSRYFGPDATWNFRANGTVNNNLNSDFFFQQINDSHVVEDLYAKPPPDGPVDGAREAIRGYVAGYNKYLADVGVANISDPHCQGADWVRPITELDAVRRFYQLALLASGAVAIDGIGSAQPPTPPVPFFDGLSQAQLLQLKERFDQMHEIGSNAYGLGRDATDNGHGMVLGNPHFPWEGSERLYQAQLTIPGVLDVEGSSLFGVPIVLIGHTISLAWSHTVSTAYRFTPYQLTIVPGSPTTYMYDGQPRAMTSRTMTVQAKQADGSLQPVSRTLWSTHYGPILTSVLNLPLFPWTPVTAFAMRDVNAANFRYINHFFAVNKAHTVGELYQIQADLHGIPWVNTIAADNAGDAYYGDVSNVPNVSNAKAQACNTPAGAAAFALLGLPILDGSKSSCEWDVDADSPQPGTFGTSHLPHLFRTDYVTNSNDSFWLTNPEEPLAGFARIIGDEETARSLRTRLGLIQVQQRLDGSDGRPGTRWSTADLQETVFGNRQYTGELARDDLATMCETLPGGMAPTSSGPPINVSAACPVLRAWDLHDNLDSNGAILFRRWFEHVRGTVPSPAPNPTIWSTPFSTADPVNTPRDLNTSNPLIKSALGDAVKDLTTAGIPLDAPLLGYQFKTKNGEDIPIHGGPGSDGVFNAINVGWSSPEAYNDVPHGSSFVMVAHFNGTVCPDVKTITTYSQSTDPTSPYFADQTRMFSNKEWVDEAYCEADIAADPNLTTQALVDSPRPQAFLPNSSWTASIVTWLGILLGLCLVVGRIVLRARRGKVAA